MTVSCELYRVVALVLSALTVSGCDLPQTSDATLVATATQAAAQAVADPSIDQDYREVLASAGTPTTGRASLKTLCLQRTEAWQRAATAGNLQAEYLLGLCELTGLARTDSEPNYAAAQRHFLIAAEAGLAIAQTEVGVSYERGRVGPVDHEQARRWYMKAADGGDAFALNHLGRVYYDCVGVPCDRELAFEYFLRPASSGLVLSQTNVADVLMRRGESEVGCGWYLLAAEQGDEVGRAGLARCRAAGVTPRRPTTER